MYILVIDESWNVLGYLAEQRCIDWDEQDAFGNSLMDCLKLHTKNGTKKEAISCFQKKCNQLYCNWLNYNKEQSL